MLVVTATQALAHRTVASVMPLHLVKNHSHVMAQAHLVAIAIVVTVTAVATARMQIVAITVY
jgi:hypothetical protein